LHPALSSSALQTSTKTHLNPCRPAHRNVWLSGGVQCSHSLYKVHRSHRCTARSGVPWHPLHRRQRGIPMHSHEHMSQIRALAGAPRGRSGRLCPDFNMVKGYVVTFFDSKTGVESGGAPRLSRPPPAARASRPPPHPVRGGTGRARHCVII
jgi:hypothetical protein